MITARNAHAGAGTQNAGLAFGGSSPTLVACTEHYNGTSWSAGGALITARNAHAGAGTQTSGLAFGGGTPSHVACTEEYDGTSWSAGSALITARSYIGGAGTQSDGLGFGGFTPSNVSCTEEYKRNLIPPFSCYLPGAWSLGGDLITARRGLGGDRDWETTKS